MLDVGSGLGGPARTAASAFKCSVLGVDLTEEYVPRPVRPPRVGSPRVSVPPEPPHDMPVPPPRRLPLPLRYVAAANAMCAWPQIGLADSVTLVVGDACAMAAVVADESMDKAYMLHVGMNIRDKARLAKEIHRVLRPAPRPRAAATAAWLHTLLHSSAGSGARILRLSASLLGSLPA